MQKEQRYFSVSLRSEGGAKRIAGRAAAYGVLSSDLGGFRERIQRGAFANVVRSGADCYALFNHDPNKVLGRTKSGTLQLRDTDGGLDFMLDLPDTELGNELGVLCERGDVNQCSFGFSVEKEDQDWTDEDYEDEEGERCKGTVRTLRNISRLLDISLVTYPAYTKGTSAVVARSFFPEGIPVEVRQHVVVPTQEQVSDSERARLRMVRLRESL